MRSLIIAGLIVFGTALVPALSAPPVFTTLHSFPANDDGAQPAGALTLADTVLYGSTASGGNDFAGTVFRTDQTTGVTTTL